MATATIETIETIETEQYECVALHALGWKGSRNWVRRTLKPRVVGQNKKKR
jgi:hypothetical protein